MLEARCALLMPNLTACYTHHGGVALKSVDHLLSKTDFFAEDMGGVGACTSRLALLDLTIQAVCDVATSSSRETVFRTCVEFVERAMALTSAPLNTRTIGIVLRFHLSIFHFGASILTSSVASNPLWSTNCMVQHWRGWRPTEVTLGSKTFRFCSRLGRASICAGCASSFCPRP